MCGFYQQNSKVLEFELEKDIDKIKLNHYISRKENFQRIKRELPRGQFYLTTREVATTIDVSLKKAKTLIDGFVELGIISPISISKSKNTPSIYSYISASKMETNEETVEETNKETNKETVEETNKHSNINGLMPINETVKETNEETVKETNEETNEETYKKELLKTVSKKNTKKSIEKEIGNDVTQVLPSVTNKVNNDTKIINALFEEYTEDTELREALTEFAKMRKKKKSELTVRGAKSLLKELDKLAAGDILTAIAIVDQTLTNSWKGFFPLKTQSNNTTYNKGKQKTELDIAAEEAMMAMFGNV